MSSVVNYSKSHEYKTENWVSSIGNFLNNGLKLRLCMRIQLWYWAKHRIENVVEVLANLIIFRSPLKQNSVLNELKFLISFNYQITNFRWKNQNFVVCGDYLSIILPKSKVISLETAGVLHSKLNTPVQKVADVVSTVKRWRFPGGVRVPVWSNFVLIYLR